MADVATLKTGIYSLLSTVSGIGLVHKRHRIIKTPKNFNSIFTSGGIINVWEITNPMITNMPEGIGSGSNIVRRAWTFQIEGWYLFNDTGDSEATFDALVEAIQEKFKGQHQIGGASYQSECIQVPAKEIGSFNGILSHHAVLTIEISKSV